MSDKRFKATCSAPSGCDESGIDVFFTDGDDTADDKRMLQYAPINFRSVEAFEAFKTCLKRGGIEVELR